MNKIEITYFGQQALVDVDQVKLLQKKESLVAQAKIAPRVDLLKIMPKIIRLNRKIRQNVIFL